MFACIPNIVRDYDVSFAEFILDRYEAKSLMNVAWVNKCAERIIMVYCVKCGAKNSDDAKTCSQCGAPLYTLGESGQARSVEKECFGTRRGVEPHERIEEECRSIPKGGAVIGLAIGLIIVIAGLSLLLQELYGINIPWWPFVIIIFGIIIIIGAFYGLSRKY